MNHAGRDPAHVARPRGQDAGERVSDWEEHGVTAHGDAAASRGDGAFWSQIGETVPQLSVHGITSRLHTVTGQATRCSYHVGEAGKIDVC